MFDTSRYNLTNNAENIAFTKEAKPWGDLGTEVPGLMTTGEALRASNLDWGVKKLPVLSSINLAPIDNQFAIHRDDTNIPLGVVKGQYEPIPNDEAFGFFDKVLGDGQGQINMAAALGKGERVIMIAQMPETVEILPGDPVERFLLISTSHNGSSSTEVLFTNTRVVCKNTLNAAVKGSINKVKIRHCKNYKEKLVQAEITLASSSKYWERMTEASMAMASTSVSRIEVGSFIDAMFPKKEDAKRNTVTKERELFANLMETGMGTDIPGVKGSVWGLWNAYTEMLDHHSSVRKGGNRWERSILGNGQGKRQKAFDNLIALV